MDGTIQNIEIEYTKDNARIEFEKGNYPLANTIYEALWNNSNKDDAYLLFDYGKSLRKVNESIKFVEICRESNANRKIMANKFIISTLCWCLYDCYIKNYSVVDKDNFNNFIKRAEFIKKNCSQMNADEHFITPYVLTIKKVVKIYNERASRNFKEIIKWLSYLDPDRLSEKVFNFQDETGKERELASPKEFYYQHMAKALEKTEKYQDCITICETAFNQINRFHYRNHTWLKARMYYSRCMLQDKYNIENAISEYKELACKENYWFMYHKLSQICFRFNKIPDALLYASKAYSKFEYEKMVNLMLDTALLWQASGNNTNAKIFFQASAYFKKKYGWPVTEELKYAIITFEIDDTEKPNIKVMQHISSDYIAKIEGKAEKYEGKVDNILPHGCSGFIKPSHDDSNIYFNMNDVLGKRKLVKGDCVKYEILNTNNGKTKAVKVSIKELR